jgi:hypothetical protein
LTNYELHQQKDSEALKGTLEAGLEMIVSQLRKGQLRLPASRRQPIHIHCFPPPLCVAAVQALCDGGR